MRNFVQDGDVLTLTPATDVPSGTGYQFGAALFGVAVRDVAANTPGEFKMEGVVAIAKASALAIAVGDRLFWNPAGATVDKTATGQLHVGIAVEAAANPSSAVKMLLEVAVPAGT
jgi:predicted RecA/RadA family phage recombinase